MPKSESDRKGALAGALERVESTEPQADQDFLDASGIVAQVATVAVVGIGCAATFEAALLPGFFLGIAAMWAPKYFPKMGKVSQGKFGTFSRGVQAIELVLGAANLVRRPMRGSTLRTRSR